MTGRVYLDHNATSPLRPVARAAMLSALDNPSNPSSVHAEGRAARARIEMAREKVAQLAGTEPQAVTFTSGATEANALALSPEMEIGTRSVRFDVLIHSAVEHPSVRAGGRFAEERVEVVPVDAEGVTDLAALEAMLAKHTASGHRALVSIMAANNETGVVQPLHAIATIVHDAGGILHADAVQLAGRLPLALETADADLISISSHKLGGPLGAGALIARGDIRITPMLRGGGQEQGRRAGTENTSAIAGFGAAASQAALDVENESLRLKRLRDLAEAGIRNIADDAVFLSSRAQRLPNTICFAVPGIAAETAIIAFDLEGVSLSAGAACSSGKTGVSETLKAMKVEPEIARGAMRVSLGWNSSEEDVSRFLEVWKRVYVNVGKRAKERAA